MKVSEIKIGETYNHIQILNDLGWINHLRKYECKCTLCGKLFTIDSGKIGVTKSCRDCFGKSHRKDLTGQRFGRLVALELDGIRNKTTFWRCQCDCGNIVVVDYPNLHSGNTKSCGCYKKECGYQRGISQRKCASLDSKLTSKHPLYQTWTNLLNRCRNPRNRAYNDYGGRGIKVCERWSGDLGFENFVNDMGERPSKKHSIDRMDNDGDYCPENCRWATQKEQANNQRRNNYIISNGEKISLTSLCERHGLIYDFCKYHLKYGVDINIIITQCLQKLNGKRAHVPVLAKNCNGNRIISKDVITTLNQIYNNDRNSH